MANFNTHLVIGTIATGMAATLTYAAQLSSLPLSLTLWGLGIWGSLLPDIDSDNSTVLKLLFNGLALLAMALTLFWFAPQLDLAPLWTALACAYAFVRFPLIYMFKKFSRHRGTFHSLLAVLFFGSVMACFTYRVLNQSALICWLAAGFVALGYLIHLVLDECYSVDLSNTKIKRSFGTALKPLSTQYFSCSLVMGAIAAYLFWLGPPIQQSWQQITATLSTYILSTLA